VTTSEFLWGSESPNPLQARDEPFAPTREGPPTRSEFSPCGSGIPSAPGATRSDVRCGARRMQECDHPSRA